MEAAVAALEGRRGEALASFREAIGALEAMGLPWLVARISSIAAVTLGPDDPASQTHAERARAIFDSLGAVRWIEMLDRTLANVGTGPTTSTTSSADREALEGVG
jgi:hypothetical protein